MTNSTVGELVAERPGRARVFEQYGIDYCCGGKKPLETACAEKGLDAQIVSQALLDSDSASAGQHETDWSSAPLTDLADHIERTHHAYLRRELPRLTAMLAKVSTAHGPRRPEMLQVERLFAGLADELAAHMMKEEQVLFPIIRTLEASHDLPEFHCGSVKNPIHVMEYEHDSAGSTLATIRQLTSGFIPPPDACNTFRAALSALQELEADLHRHIHKENSILFPRAIELESTLTSDRCPRR